MTRWHVIFSGRVQHVGFRYTAYYFTRDLYLTGPTSGGFGSGGIRVRSDDSLTCRSPHRSGL